MGKIGKKTILWKKLIIISSLILIISVILVLKNKNLIYIQSKNKKYDESKYSNSQLEKTDTTYEVKNINGNNMQILVNIQNENGIKSIVKPNGDEINVYNKKKISLDYEVTSGNVYIFKIKTMDESDFKEYKLVAELESKPKISENISEPYPILATTGIKINKNVEIDYGENTENYYSLDDGKTWKKYTGQIDIYKQGIVSAKSIIDGEITKEEKKDIKFDLEKDALEGEAYDRNEETYTKITCGKTRIVKIDKTMWEKYVALTLKSANAGSGFVNKIECKDKEGNVLNSFNVAYSYSWENEKFYIPENTETLEFRANSFDGRFYFEIYEIKEYDTPIIEKIDNECAILMNSGIKKPTNTISVKYFDTTVKRLYKIGDSEWKEYNGDITLNVGETIYCKGINKDNEETEISSFETIYPTNSLKAEAYDGDKSTYTKIPCGQTEIIKIDKTMWKKNVHLTLKSANAGSGFLNKIECKDKDGNVLNSFNVAYSYSWENKEFYIPENTATLEFNANRFDGRFYFEIYEIENE